jgi:hypothetical protein
MEKAYNRPKQDKKKMEVLKTERMLIVKEVQNIILYVDILAFEKF